MSIQKNDLTLENLAAKMVMLEEANARMAQQLAALQTERTPASSPPAGRRTRETPSRRGLLRSALGATVATVGAGVLLDGRMGTALATGSEGQTTFTSATTTPTVTIKNTSSGVGLSIANTGTGLGLSTTNKVSLGGTTVASLTSTAAVTGASTAASAAISGTNSSTAGSAIGVYGKISSTAPGGFSAGIRGVNSGTSGNGIGVYGSQAGSGWGVYGTSVTGIGVYGVSTSSSSGTGVYASGAGYGVQAYGGNYGIYASGTNYGAYVYCSGGTGVYAYTPSGTAVVGSSGGSYGVEGTASYAGVSGTSTSGYGGFFAGDATSGSGYSGVYANGDTGVYGVGTTYGVYGYGSYYGVYGNGTVYGVYGYTNTPGSLYGGYFYGNTSSPPVYGAVASNGSSSTSAYLATTNTDSVTGNPWAAEFYDDVYVAGYLYKAGGGFMIDHPLDPTNKYLIHSFVESPDMLNMYSGLAVLGPSGQAVVQLPGWFTAVNGNYRYQLTAIGAPGSTLHIASEIANNQFTIGGGTAGMTVSWLVLSTRQDAYANAHRMATEVDKPAAERGTYLHPTVHGAAASASLQAAREQALQAKATRMGLSLPTGAPVAPTRPVAPHISTPPAAPTPPTQDGTPTDVDSSL